MRQIVLDVETTGLDPRDHRIVEIGCLELFNYLPTGKTFQQYINPDRPMSEGASKVSGLTDEFLKPFPVFSTVVQSFLEFIGDAELIIHNADFDVGFINSELRRLRLAELTNSVIDTLKIARQKFPAGPNNLDALCKRYGIDIAHRTKHGALLDSELLARVYLELQGGRQMGLGLAGSEIVVEITESLVPQHTYTRQPYLHVPTPEEQEAHERLKAQIKNPLWAQA